MNAKVVNLFLMAVWLAIFLGLLTRDEWMTAELLDRVNGPHTRLVLRVAGVLFVWNALRLWLATRVVRPPDPRAGDERRHRVRRKLGAEPTVTDPQFRFDDPK